MRSSIRGGRISIEVSAVGKVIEQVFTVFCRDRRYLLALVFRFASVGRYVDDTFHLSRLDVVHHDVSIMNVIARVVIATTERGSRFVLRHGRRVVLLQLNAHRGSSALYVVTYFVRTGGEE